MTTCLCRGGICELNIRCSWPQHMYATKPVESELQGWQVSGRKGTQRPTKRIKAPQCTPGQKTTSTRLVWKVTDGCTFREEGRSEHVLR